MFCEKCGAKNDNDSKFCEKCGSVFDSTPVYQPAAPKKKMSMKNKIILISSLALVCVLAILYYIGGIINDPKNIVENYFKGITSGDYVAVYANLDIPEGVFTTQEMFESAAKEYYDEYKGNVTNYIIKESLSTDYFTKSYTVQYTLEGSSSTQSMSINLTKQNSKKWLIYDDYKVGSEMVLANNYSVIVPTDAKAYIDGIEISSEYLEHSYENGECFVVPNLFYGKHTFKASAPYMMDVTEEREVSNDGSCELYAKALSKTAKEEIKKFAKNAVQQVYNCAVAGDSYSSVSKFFSKNNTESEQGYAQLCENLNTESSKITGITISGFDIEENLDGSLITGSNVAYEAYIETMYDYTGTYTNMYSNETESIDGSDLNYMFLTFEYEDGKWLLGNFDFYFYY